MSADRAPGPGFDQVASPLLEYVTTQGCSDCLRFEELLAQIHPDFPTVEVREVAGETARGLQISVGRGVLRFPIIVLDDEVIGIESISEDALRQALERRLAVG